MNFLPPLRRSIEQDHAKAVAKGNFELGWCPCGEELDSECECGIDRLGYVQGKGEPLKRSAEHPRLAAPSEPREER